jgi:histidinol-phosphate aminotransferase
MSPADDKADDSPAGDAASLVARWIRRDIRALSAYHVPDSGDLIKLDAMENPYSWPPALVEAWLVRLREVSLNRYPDPGAHALKARLREAMEIPQSAEVLLGNGSDELIQMIAMALAGPDRVVLSPEPSFVMYRMIATFCGMQYAGVDLREDFTLDRDAMLSAIEVHRPAVIFIAYPNNPSGNLFAEDDLEAMLEAAPGLVVIDEAYTPFAGRSFMTRLGEHGNLLVMRTVSKMGLAGLRLGYLAGAPELLTEFDKVRLPYNINVLTQASAEFALSHREIFDEQSARIRTDRETLFTALNAIAGVTAYPSAANFILFRVPPGKSANIFSALRDRGVLIKNMDPAGGLLRDCLRVTVGTPQENSAFLDALRAALGSDR